MIKDFKSQKNQELIQKIRVCQKNQKIRMRKENPNNKNSLMKINSRTILRSNSP